MAEPASIKLDDRLAVEEVIHRYFWLVDHGQANLVAELFAVDGSLMVEGREALRGQEKISEAMRVRALQVHVTTRHVISNIRVSSQNTGGLTACSLLTLYRSEDAQRRNAVPSVVADIDDVFVSERGQWKILSRTLKTVFSSA